MVCSLLGQEQDGGSLTLPSVVRKANRRYEPSGKMNHRLTSGLTSHREKAPLPSHFNIKENTTILESSPSKNCLRVIIVSLIKTDVNV